MNCDLDDENVDSVHDVTKYRECETLAPSVDLTSQQSDLHQMLLDMSRRMDEMQEKFDKRLQSVESQLSEISQNVNILFFIFNVYSVFHYRSAKLQIQI